MPKGISRAHELAREFMRKNPQLTEKRSIAKNLRALHPVVFTSVEQARTIVRYITGQTGARSRKLVADKSQFAKAGKQSDSKVVIPKGATEFQEPIEIKGPCKALIINDLHIPYHDERATEAAINYGIKHGCDTLYINGDFGDHYQISRFDKDPECRDLATEIDIQEQVLDVLGPLFKRKYLKCGNHDERWEKYLFQNAPALGRIAKLRLPKILELERRGYQWVDSKQWAVLGMLPLFHGHELFGGSSVNPARGAYMKVTNTIVVGHHHRTSQHVEPQSLTQEQIVAWSVGCLCDMRPRYATVNKWNLGFAVCDVAADGQFELANMRIDNTRGYKVYR